MSTVSYKYHRRPRIAAFDGGSKFVVVWDGAIQVGEEDVFARRFLWGTTPLDDDEFVVNNTFIGSQRGPAVAGNPSAKGGFVVVWSGGITDNDIWARAFHWDGAPVADAVRVNTGTLGNQILPDVAMASDGSFVVVWRTIGFSDLFLQRFEADQTPIGSPISVRRYTASGPQALAITGASDGTTLVAWESPLQDGSGSGIFAQRFGPNGERLFR